MPGQSTNMIGDYTFAELNSMSQEELAEAQSREFRKATAVAGRSEAAGVFVGTSVPSSDPQPQPSGNVWKRKKSGQDFICPSGQTCRLRPLEPEALLREGILDQVTRLDGLAQQLVNNSQGLPPDKMQVPSRDDLAELLKLVNTATLLAVVEPRIYPDDAQGLGEDDIRVSDIDLGDRLAILEESLKGVKALDNFRQP